MTFTVAVGASDIEFPGETVLDAAERAGYALPYSCRKGVCSTCEGRPSRWRSRFRRESGFPVEFGPFPTAVPPLR
jgi:2Fe-2S iron-sulfur cluster binding domain